MSTKPGTIWRERLLARYYYGRPGWSDGTTQFHALVGQFAKPGCQILELGAGPDNPTTAFLAQQGVVTGLDIDPAVKSNHHCRNAYVYDGVHVPLPSNSFDLVVSNYVCEHIEDPPRVCREIHRVLRPGGAALAGGMYRFMPEWRRVSSDELRQTAAKTGIGSIRVYDDMGQWVEILKPAPAPAQPAPPSAARILPVLPLPDVVIFPNSISPLFVVRPPSIAQR